MLLEIKSCRRVMIRISLQYVSKGPISTNPGLVQIMDWSQTGDMPLSELEKS